MFRCKSLITSLLIAFLLAGCSGPTILSQNTDSVTYGFPNGRHGLEDAQEEADAFCHKRGRTAELQSNKACTAPCLSCALQCRATFVCR